MFRKQESKYANDNIMLIQINSIQHILLFTALVNNYI